jgi:D-lactate dehydrogenase (cytochrome)
VATSLKTPSTQPNVYQPVTPAIIAELNDIVGANNVSVTDADRDARAYDVSGHPPHPSEVVVWPETAAQTAQLLHFANQKRIPVTPWGAGTSVEGNPIPILGGILLSTERMTAIIQIHADDFQATVQPGLKYRDLNRHLEPLNLFFPPDPGGDATIGGMLANNAAGAKAVKYGACKDNVLRLQVALADGRLIEVGSRSIKQSSGYDLLHLFVGSEGTLGVITEATVKLTPIPNLMSAVVASFETVQAAVQSVVAIRRSGLDPAALEFIDAATAKMLNQAENTHLLDERPNLFMEFHAAHETALTLGLELVREICQAAGLVSFRATTDPAERRRLWYARHNAYTIAVKAHSGQRFLVLDTAVPISAYPAIVTQVEQSLKRHNVVGYMLGHAGDGNMHVLIPYADLETYRRGLAFNEDLVIRALELGGTATGEHGVGLGKIQYMQREHGPALDIMRSLKQTLDPNNILNPGKIFPKEG